MPNWELDYNNGRFNSVWTLDMNDLMDRNEFSNRMDSINKVAYENRFFAKWVTVIVTSIGCIALVVGIAMTGLSAPWYPRQQDKLAGGIVIVVVGIITLGGYIFLYTRKRNHFEHAVNKHLYHLNAMDNPRVNWILEATTIVQKGRIEIGREKTYKLIVQTAR